ncbi:hypothetical protein ACFODO_11510 [Acinetobacter sichuanensis]|uniref:Uncharacterized protein n=1 Tax=Acinetobacter sichuanensis TaxID=2136183 RepID=A0A371YIV6_9GAMM|nr:hypothetical protein [Acinetobacter sichuanensis]RFC81360.1 hypothetical protein C9E89_022275 [Acinetobacter sichuanensis]
MIQKILKDLEKGPTILSLNKIMSVITCLQKLDEEELLKNDEDFLTIMDILANGYLDSAIFEVNDSNQVILKDMSIWLSNLGKKYSFGHNNDDLSAYTGLFVQTM